MSWFDSITSGLGHAANFITGKPEPTSPRQQAVANSGAAQTAGNATGLSPFMRMLGMTPAAVPEDRMARPSELSDLAQGKLPPTAGGNASFQNPMGSSREGLGGRQTKSSNGFESNPTGGYKLPSTQNWSGNGTSRGNRQSDIDARDKGMKLGAPEVYQPDLSKLTGAGVTTNNTGQRTYGEYMAAKAKAEKEGTPLPANTSGGGAFTDSKYGTASWNDFKPKTKIGADGKGNTSIWNAGGVAGGEYKTGYRGMTTSDDGRHHADAEVGLVASGGASGSIGLDTKNGLMAQGGVGGKIGAYGQANADTKTNSVKFGGQDYDAGIGAHAEAFVGAKAGMGGAVGIGPDFVGAKGNIGAFVGAEAAADIHGNLGPLAGKVGASGMVGAGIGADGDISFTDGKFHIGGKMFAALGYGGSLSADMTVDVGAIGKSAYNLGATGLDYAGKGLSAAGHGIYDAGSTALDYGGKAASAVGTGIANAGSAALDYGGRAASAVGSGLSSAGSAISDGVGSLFSW